jgi:putative transposase
VELNPVRAGLAGDASEWPWSSATAHLTGWDASGLLDLCEWRQRWSGAIWREALDRGIADASLLARIREATRRGRPLGDENFTKRLEVTIGRPIRMRRRGRPHKAPEPKLVTA